MAVTSTSVRLSDLENCAFGLKDAQPEEDSTIAARIQRLMDEYKSEGMRTTVEAVIVCHQHGHPHILLLQMGTFFKLPGDQLKSKEDAVKGLKRILNLRLAPPHSTSNSTTGEGNGVNWQVEELLATWTRPNFDTIMYPYHTPHIKSPKEQKLIYLVTLAEGKSVLACPKNMKLVAVPLFELYDNQARYGPVISSVPHLLSRFSFSAM